MKVKTIQSKEENVDPIYKQKLQYTNPKEKD